MNCPENSLCAPYGPGFFECSCVENFHGYKCLREVGSESCFACIIIHHQLLSPFLSLRLTQTQLNVLIILRDTSVKLSTGGVPGSAGVRAPRSIYSCDFLPAVGHAEAEGQISVKLAAFNLTETDFPERDKADRAWTDPGLLFKNILRIL